MGKIDWHQTTIKEKKAPLCLEILNALYVMYHVLTFAPWLRARSIIDSLTNGHNQIAKIE